MSCLTLLATMLGCGQTMGPDDLSGAGSGNKAVTITPQQVDLVPGQGLQFSASVKKKRGNNIGNFGGEISWEATGGSISTTGLYKAGSQTGNYWVKAFSGNDYAQATVRILASTTTPTSISVSPGQAEIDPDGQVKFSATVRDQNGNPLSASVSWKATGGTITTNGTYTAGSQVGSYQVTATHSELSKSASVDIVSSPTPTPVDGVAIRPGESIQAAVDGHGAGTTFVVKAGVHRRQTVVPKDGMTFVGEAGAVLDGENAVAHAFRGDVKVARDVTIRNLEIRNYYNPLQSGAIDVGGDTGSSGWVIENCNIHHNYSGGIRTGDRMVIRGNNIHHNGQIGIKGGGDGMLVEGNEIAYNNTRDVIITERFWEAGGTKFVKTRNLVVRNNYVHHNIEDGLWFDIDNIYALVEGNRIVGNTRSGIHWEISYDAVIRNNYVEGSAIGEDVWHRGAIRISSSSNVEIYGNTVVNNQNGIVAINQPNRGTGAYGVREVKNLYVHDNIIRQSSGALSGLGIAGSDDPTYFTGKGNRWERNTYRVPEPTTARWHWQGGLVGWDIWKGFHTTEVLGS
jgi:parallel beta-helix repeat protein